MHPIINYLKTKVIELKSKGVNDDAIRVILKETLQDYILVAIYSNEKYRNFVFVGGTALRKLFALNRFSEDLDFNIEAEVDNQELGEYLLSFFKGLDFYPIDFQVQKNANINRLTVKFKILNDIGLSPNIESKLHVKVETTVAQIYPVEIFSKNMANTPVVIKSYPLPTQMANKILACLNRIFEVGDTGIKVKGRDYYDLIWYMEKGIKPNEKVFLDANPEYTTGKVFDLLDKKISGIKSSDLLIDLRNFFEDINAITIWCNHFHELYAKYRQDYKNT